VSFVRQLTPKLFPSAAELLAQAFFTNPAHIYICPDKAARIAQLEWLLGGNLRLQPDLSAISCIAQGSVVDAMGFWTRPRSPEIGIKSKIRAGILAAPFHLGLRGVRRLLEVTSEIDRHRDQALVGQSYWYLNNMAVREKHRGQGIGGKMLSEQLYALAERDPKAVAGLAQELVHEQCNEVVVRDMKSAELAEAREIIAVNSLCRASPVVQLDGKPVGSGAPGPWQQRILDFLTSEP